MVSTHAVTFERFIESLGDACLVLSGDSAILAANGRAANLYGADRSTIVGRQLDELCIGADLHAIEAALGTCGEHATREFTARQRRFDGTEFLGSFTAMRHSLEVSGKTLLVLIVRELEHAVSVCKHSLELHHVMLEHALDGIIAHTVDGELLYANRAAERQWGMTFEQARDAGTWGWISKHCKRLMASSMAELLEHGKARFERHCTSPAGSDLHQEIHSSLVDSDQGRIVVSTIRDIAERIQAEEMVRYLAYHDMLTGLANRALLDQELAHAIASAERHHDVVGVVFLDLDDFKPINDTYGHAIGDAALREVASRLSASVREYDTVARLGGDEFVVVLPRLSEPQMLDRVAAKLLAEVARPIALSDVEFSVTATVGTALYQPGDSADSMLTRADLEMYHDREQRREVRAAATR